MIAFDDRLKLANQIAEMLQSYAGAFDALDKAIAQNDASVSIDSLSIPPDVAVAVYSVLTEARIVERFGNDPLERLSARSYRVCDAKSAARIIDDARIICALSADKRDMNILRTWPFADPLPGHLARQTRDLDLRYVTLLASSTDHAFVVTPFLNIPAAERLAAALETAIHSGATVDLITYLAHQPGSARSAIEYLHQHLQSRVGSLKAKRFTAYSNLQVDSMIHAKLLLIDAQTGYLGSANTTGQGFANHLEVGIELNSMQTSVLEGIIRHVIVQEYVVPIDNFK